MALKARLPEKRYLNREEAATWLGVSTDTFSRLDIPFCDFGPRCRRWDVVDIIAFAEESKTCDSARTSETKRRRRQCDSTNEAARPTGGSTGRTTTAAATAKALGLKIGP